MREKMREHLLHLDPQAFDLKQAPGGIADIEFIVQFLVLANANAVPSITRWTDMVRLLEALRAADLIPAADAGLLRDAYCHYRAQVHRCALLEAPAIVPVAENAAESSAISAIWRRVMLA